MGDDMATTFATLAEAKEKIGARLEEDEAKRNLFAEEREEIEREAYRILHPAGLETSMAGLWKLYKGLGRPIRGLEGIFELVSDTVVEASCFHYLARSEADLFKEYFTPLAEKLEHALSEVKVPVASGRRFRRKVTETPLAELAGMDQEEIGYLMAYAKSKLEADARHPDRLMESNVPPQTPEQEQAAKAFTAAVEEYTGSFAERHAVARLLEGVDWNLKSGSGYAGYKLHEALLPVKPFHSMYDGDDWEGQLLTRRQAKTLKEALDCVGVGEASKKIGPDEIHGFGLDYRKKGYSMLDARLVCLYAHLLHIMENGPVAETHSDVHVHHL